MRFMILVKANPDSEAGVMPSEDILLEMGRFNDTLVNAGVLLAADGLHPSAKGAHLHFGPSGLTQVTDGPFAETKELIAGYWIIEAKSKAEAIERFRACPFRAGHLELRQLFEAADFEPAVSTDEGRALLAAEEEFRNRPAG
jgi:hypothetical protein